LASDDNTTIEVMSAHDKTPTHILSDHEDNPSPAKKSRRSHPPPRFPATTQNSGQDPFTDTALNTLTPSAPPLTPIFGDLGNDFVIDSTFKNLTRYRKAVENGLRLKSKLVSTTTSADSPQTTTNDHTIVEGTSNDNDNTSATPTITTTTGTPQATIDTPQATTDNPQTTADAPPTSDALPTTNDAPQTTTEDLVMVEGTSNDTLSTTPEVWDWENAPVLPSREFKVVKVFKTSTWRKVGGQINSDSQSLDVWTISVHNEKQPESPTYEVYGVDAALKLVKRDTVLSGGVLDSTICANEVEVRELGTVVCSLMDRLPFDISTDLWHANPKAFRNMKQLHPLRRLVQARALDVWKSPFDRQILHESHRDLGLGIEAYSQQDVFSDTCISYNVRVLHNDQRGYRGKAPSSKALKLHLERGMCVRVTIEYDSLDIEKVGALPDLPVASFAYVFTPTSSAPFTHQQQMLLKAFNDIQHCLTFKVGSKDAVRKYIAAHLAKLTKPALLKPLPTKTPPNSKVPPQEAPKHRKNKSGLWHLHRMEGGLQVTPHPTTSSMFTGKVPTITIRHGSSVMAAHVLNKMIALRTEQQNLDDIWESGCLEADHVSLAHVSLDFVKDNYCTCDDTADKLLVHHVCMLCFGVFPCSALPLSQDGRRICQHHIDQGADKAGDQAITIPLFRRLTRILGNIRKAEIRKGASPADVNTAPLKSVLEKDIEDAAKGLWRDAYFNALRSRIDGWLGATGEVGTLKSPFQISVDAIHRFIIRNGIAIQHHPENVVLTALCLNCIKGKWGVAIVGIVGAAARQAQREKDGAVRDLDFWHDFDNAMERLHHLSMQVTSIGSKRNQITADMVDDVAMATYLDSLSTSSWSPNHPPPIPSYLRGKPITAGEAVNEDHIEKGEPPSILPRVDKAWIEAMATKVRCPNWPRWSDADKERLLKLVNEMEASNSINPKHLRLPRSKTGAPWPFMKRHMFEDDIDVWDWLFNECIARYWRMFYTCNILHVTDESPDTILLEIIVQWFRNGGVDSYIRCEMTIWKGHPQVFSFGRSDNVLPGSAMVTGWTVSRPVSLREHYNMERSTVVVQPWFINSFWSDFSTDLHELMFKLLCELPERTIHFGRLPRYTDPVQYPKESIVSRRRRGEEVQDVVDVEDVEDEFEEDAQVEEDAFEDDEEDAEGPGDAGEVSPEDRQLLQDRLDELNVEIGGLDPGVMANETCQDELSAMRRAVAKGDKSSFDTHYSDLVAIIRTLLDTASQLASLAEASQLAAAPQPTTEECSICHEPAIENSMMSCSNPKHHAVFHFWCIDHDATHVPGSKVLCPDCSPEQQMQQGDLQSSPFRNMVNLGSTCYVSSSVQILLRIKPVIDLISDNNNLIATPDAVSGRQPREWLDGHKLKGITPAQVDALSAKQMTNAHALCQDLASLNSHLGTPGPVSTPRTRQFLNRLKDLKPSDWTVGNINDPADLFNAVLDYIILATDASEVSGRGKVAKLVKQKEQDRVADLKQDSFLCYDAYVSEGRTSAVVGQFWMQSAKEYECRNCGVVTRSFDHEPWFNPELPPKGADASDYTLIKILKAWKATITNVNPECGACKSATNASVINRKITVSPRTLVVAFKRLDGERLEHVDLPEYLDLSPYADKARLRSDPGQVAVQFNQKPIYRLMAIDMYLGRHFVAYVLIDGTWYVFDDKLRQPPVAKHPQSAILEGWIPYYAVYEQLKDKTSLPSVSGEPTMGHMFTKTAKAPAAKVRDLYAEDEDPPVDDGFQAAGTADEAEAPASASAPPPSPDGKSHDAGSGADDGSHAPDDMDVEFSCGHCSLVFPKQGLLHAHLKQAHAADMKTLLGDKWVKVFRKNLDDVHKDIDTIEQNHDNLRQHISWQEMKFELGLLKQGRRHDQALCEILADRAVEMREDAEELQRQSAQILAREKQLNERAASLRRRSRLSEREVQMQKEFDELNM
jgi:ubiquitin C-terminal hydrolase